MTDEDVASPQNDPAPVGDPTLESVACDAAVAVNLAVGDLCPAHNLVRANSEATGRHQRRWPDLCGSGFFPEGDRAPARGANQVLWGP